MRSRLKSLLNATIQVSKQRSVTRRLVAVLFREGLGEPNEGSLPDADDLLTCLLLLAEGLCDALELGN